MGRVEFRCCRACIENIIEVCIINIQIYSWMYVCKVTLKVCALGTESGNE